MGLVANSKIRDLAHKVWVDVDMRDEVEDIVAEMFGPDSVSYASPAQIDIMRSLAAMRLSEEIHRFASDQVVETVGDWSNE